MCKNKLSNTMDIFDEYEKRFCEKKMSLPKRKMWQDDDRKQVLETVKKVLRFDEKLIPEIKIHDQQQDSIDDVEFKHMLFESWQDFYGISTLFIPDESFSRPCPLVIVCPGHGKYGRLSYGYAEMALQLAKQGSYALLLENIGQGCREKFGHWDVPETFYCGLTLQGMIIAETMAWIKYMKAQKFIDSTRIGACGNSGGGTYTQFLAALEPSLSAVASCGYPSEYSYIFEKERKHCDCNILPGVIGKLEMWQVYSLFAPKPLLLDSGLNDSLIPVEYFHRNARKVKYVYEMTGHGENFKAVATNTLHPWETVDIQKISDFFADNFSIKKMPVPNEELKLSSCNVRLEIPESAISTAQAAQNISKINAPENVKLWDVFKPVYNGKNINPEEIVTDVGRGDLMRVFSQFEAVLTD